MSDQARELRSTSSSLQSSAEAAPEAVEAAPEAVEAAPEAGAAAIADSEADSEETDSHSAGRRSRQGHHHSGPFPLIRPCVVCARPRWFLSFFYRRKPDSLLSWHSRCASCCRKRQLERSGRSSTSAAD